MSENSVKTQNICESAYLLTQGLKLHNIETIMENKRLVCKFTFTGENLFQAQNDYHNGKAHVNLWEFKTNFYRVNSLIEMARSEYRENKSSKVEEV